MRTLRIEVGMPLTALVEGIRAYADEASPIATLEYLRALESGVAAPHVEHLSYLEDAYHVARGTLHRIYGYLLCAEQPFQDGRHPIMLPQLESSLESRMSRLDEEIANNVQPTQEDLEAELIARREARALLLAYRQGKSPEEAYAELSRPATAGSKKLTSGGR